MISISRFRLLALVALILAFSLMTISNHTTSAQEKSSALKESAELKNLKYRLLGPAWGGRVSRVSGAPGGTEFYAATASGGVWKSGDNGINWQPIFDDQAISSTGSI
ncbi:MAG: hypothetical protein ACRD82_12125, partial [Blastocatellia bacterium]